MPQADRRALSLSPSAARTLDDLAELEQVSQTAVVERALETRLGLVDLASRIPRDALGRTIRMAVLPEGAAPPAGAEVFRIYMPLRETDPLVEPAEPVTEAPVEPKEAPTAEEEEWY